MKKKTQGKVEPPKPWPPEPGESLRSQLRTWLKEICPGQKMEDYCQIMADSAAPELMKVRIFTHDYRYSIFATGRPDEPEKIHHALLSCEVTSRKSLAGLTQHRYAHLVDGQFTRVTWELIKAAILQFELVKIAVKAREDQWRKMCSHYEQDGKRYYAEWLQCGDRIRDHKVYEFVSAKSEGVVKKPDIEQTFEELEKEKKRRGE